MNTSCSTRKRQLSWVILSPPPLFLVLCPNSATVAQNHKMRGFTCRRYQARAARAQGQGRDNTAAFASPFSTIFSVKKSRGNLAGLFQAHIYQVQWVTMVCQIHANIQHSTNTAHYETDRELISERGRAGALLTGPYDEAGEVSRR